MAHVQRDWENREFVQNVQYNIAKITDFLNKFHTSTRYRLALVNERLTTLERQMDYLEASVRNVKGGDAGDGGGDEWQRKQDPATGKWFYFNQNTGESRWE